MGILHLMKFIEKKFPSCCIADHIRLFAGKKIAIDTNVYVHKFKKTNAKYVTEPHFNEHQWIAYLAKMISILRQYDIHPVFIFDGIALEEKRDTQQKRRDAVIKMQTKTKLLEDTLQSIHVVDDPLDFDFDAQPDVPDIVLAEWNKKFKDQMFNLDEFKHIVSMRHRYDVKVVDEDFQLVKLLLQIMNVPYINAPREAEALCAYLCSTNICDATLSTDTDLLAYGCTYFLYSIDHTTHAIKYVNRTQLLQEMNLSDDQFLNMCILCGTDYNKNFAKIGPVTAYRITQRHVSIADYVRATNTVCSYDPAHIMNIFKSFGYQDDWETDDDLLAGCPDFELLSSFAEKMNIQLDIDRCHFISIPTIDATNTTDADATNTTDTDATDADVTDADATDADATDADATDADTDADADAADADADADAADADAADATTDDYGNRNCFQM